MYRGFVNQETSYELYRYFTRYPKIDSHLSLSTFSSLLLNQSLIVNNEAFFENEVKKGEWGQYYSDLVSMAKLSSNMPLTTDQTIRYNIIKFIEYHNIKGSIHDDLVFISDCAEKGIPIKLISTNKSFREALRYFFMFVENKCRPVKLINKPHLESRLNKEVSKLNINYNIREDDLLKTIISADIPETYSKYNKRIIEKTKKDYASDYEDLLKYNSNTHLTFEQFILSLLPDEHRVALSPKDLLDLLEKVNYKETQKILSHFSKLDLNKEPIDDFKDKHLDDLNKKLELASAFFKVCNFGLIAVKIALEELDGLEGSFAPDKHYVNLQLLKTKDWLYNYNKIIGAIEDSIF